MSNYGNEQLKLADALTQFSSEIKAIEADLEYYKKKTNYNKRLAFYKDQQIKVFKSILDAFNEFNSLSNQIFANQEKQNAKKDETIFKLEGVCLLHGICDVASYLAMPFNSLTNLVKQAYAEKWRQTPLQLMPGYKLIEEIKTAKTPTIDFNQLLNGAINNRNNEF